MYYRSGTINLNMVNSMSHLIQSFFDLFGKLLGWLGSMRSFCAFWFWWEGFLNISNHLPVK